jgi:small subunit ribosomal protein S16
LPLKIKLQRKGTKSKPVFRVVVQKSTEKLGGNIVDILGQYDALKDPAAFKVDAEKIKDWISRGAQPTEKIRILLGKAGILPAIDLSRLTKRKPKADASAEKEAPAATPSAAPAPAQAAKEEQK